MKLRKKKYERQNERKERKEWKAAKVSTRKLGSLILFFTATRRSPARGAKRARGGVNRSKSRSISSRRSTSSDKRMFGFYFLEELKRRSTATPSDPLRAPCISFNNRKHLSALNQRTSSRNALTQLRRNGRAQSWYTRDFESDDSDTV